MAWFVVCEQTVLLSVRSLQSHGENVHLSVGGPCLSLLLCRPRTPLMPFLMLLLVLLLKLVPDSELPCPFAALSSLISTISNLQIEMLMILPCERGKDDHWATVHWLEVFQGVLGWTFTSTNRQQSSLGSDGLMLTEGTCSHDISMHEAQQAQGDMKRISIQYIKLMIGSRLGQVRFC